MQSENVYKGYVNICFGFDEVEEFFVAIDSVYPEISTPISVGKTDINSYIDFLKKCISISISTYSLSQLRAIINSVLYLINTSIATINVLRRFSKHEHISESS